MTPYTSLLEAQAYFDTRLHVTAWSGASPLDRLKALNMATRDIDRLAYTDDKVVSTQDYEFPRGDDEDVPDDIKIACSEIALARLDGVDPDAELESASVKGERYAGVAVTYDRDSVPEHILAGIASATAWAYIKPFLQEPNNFKVSRVS